MAPIRSPEELVAWQVCMELSDVVFALTETGPASRAFRFRDQIREAAAAPAAQIAEGFGRATPREFAHYLRMAVSSLMETRTHLERGRRQGWLTEAQHHSAERLSARALDITRKLLASKRKQIEAEERQRQQRRRARTPT